MSKWEKHLKTALLLVRELRFQAVRQGLDPRAVRVALKFALMVDDYLASLTPAEEQQLQKLAQKLFLETHQIKEKLKNDDENDKRRFR